MRQQQAKQQQKIQPLELPRQAAARLLYKPTRADPSSQRPLLYFGRHHFVNKHVYRHFASTAASKVAPTPVQRYYQLSYHTQALLFQQQHGPASLSSEQQRWIERMIFATTRVTTMLDALSGKPHLQRYAQLLLQQIRQQQQGAAAAQATAAATPSTSSSSGNGSLLVSSEQLPAIEQMINTLVLTMRKESGLHHDHDEERNLLQRKWELLLIGSAEFDALVRQRHPHSTAAAATIAIATVQPSRLSQPAPRRSWQQQGEGDQLQQLDVQPLHGWLTPRPAVFTADAPLATSAVSCIVSMKWLDPRACHFCSSNREDLPALGRLLPYQEGRYYTHVNCLRWCSSAGYAATNTQHSQHSQPSLAETGNVAASVASIALPPMVIERHGVLYATVSNLLERYHQQVRCYHCGLFGATVTCAYHKVCKLSFHVLCAQAVGCILLEKVRSSTRSTAAVAATSTASSQHSSAAAVHHSKYGPFTAAAASSSSSGSSSSAAALMMEVSSEYPLVMLCPGHSHRIHDLINAAATSPSAATVSGYLPWTGAEEPKRYLLCEDTAAGQSRASSSAQQVQRMIAALTSQRKDGGLHRNQHTGYTMTAANAATGQANQQQAVSSSYPVTTSSSPAGGLRGVGGMQLYPATAAASTAAASSGAATSTRILRIGGSLCIAFLGHLSFEQMNYNSHTGNTPWIRSLPVSSNSNQANNAAEELSATSASFTPSYAFSGKFSNRDYLYFPSYRASRIFWSYLRPFQRTCYYMEILTLKDFDAIFAIEPILAKLKRKQQIKNGTAAVAVSPDELMSQAEAQQEQLYGQLFASLVALLPPSCQADRSLGSSYGSGHYAWLADYEGPIFRIQAQDDDDNEDDEDNDDSHEEEKGKEEADTATDSNSSHRGTMYSIDLDTLHRSLLERVRACQAPYFVNSEDGHGSYGSYASCSHDKRRIVDYHPRKAGTAAITASTGAVTAAAAATVPAMLGGRVEGGRGGRRGSGRPRKPVGYRKGYVDLDAAAEQQQPKPQPQLQTASSAPSSSASSYHGTAYGLSAHQFFGLGIPLVRQAMEQLPEMFFCLLAADSRARYTPRYRLPQEKDIQMVQRSLASAELGQTDRITRSGCSRSEVIANQSYAVSNAAQAGSTTTTTTTHYDNNHDGTDVSRSTKNQPRIITKILTKIAGTDTADTASAVQDDSNHNDDQELAGHQALYQEMARHYLLNPSRKLVVRKSGIHGWGLFTTKQTIFRKNEIIVEYIGEKIRQAVADQREVSYEREGVGSCYLFRLDKTEIIDATRVGGMARFMNHSCQPNAYAKIISCRSKQKVLKHEVEVEEEVEEKHIVILACRDIFGGEEVTYDYKFPIEDKKLKCYCGAPRCSGAMN